MFGYEPHHLGTGNCHSGNFTWVKESRDRNSVPTCPLHNVKVILEDEKPSRDEGQGHVRTKMLS